MKRTVIALFLVLILIGCASRQRIDHYPNHLLESQVSSLLGSVLTTNGYSNTAVKYCIWENKEINACMTVDNVLIITTGLLNQTVLRDTEERRNLLVSVISHEVAHFKLGHVEKQMNVNNATEYGIGSVLMLVDIITGIPVSLAGNLIMPTITSAYSRSQEFEADSEAVKLMRTMGIYDPKRAYTDTLQWFAEKRGDSDKWRLWSTHPPTSERIENVKIAAP